jgi:nitrogenase-associated protein
MKTIVFYEKTGCIGNRQQKDFLRSWLHDNKFHNDYTLEVRDLLATPWSADELRLFFGDKPVKQWFNQSAPRVTSGEINIDCLNEQQAITLMLADPILICRPLLQLDTKKQSGFVDGPVLASLNIFLTPEEDLQSCPMADLQPVCGSET